MRQCQQGNFRQRQREDRERVVELLAKAYWMEIETVMSYIAASVNLDGVRAQEVKQSLATMSRRSSATLRNSPSGSRSYTGSSPVPRSSAPSSPTSSLPTSRPTSST